MGSSRYVSFALVLVQFLASAALVGFARPTWDDLWQIALLLCGVLAGLWAVWTVGLVRLRVMPEVVDRTELRTDGPFRFVRHPMYSALMAVSASLTIMPFAMWKAPTLVLLILVLYWKSTIEEVQLQERFSGYAEYKKRTKRFVPFVF